jgi:hypothetical protein
MPLRITIDIFSGRPNPVIELEGKTAAEALRRLRPIEKLPRREALPPPPTLGYRGLIVERDGGRGDGLPRMFRVADGRLFGADLAHRASDEGFEDFVCGSTGPRKPGVRRDFDDFATRELRRFRKWYRVYRPVKPRKPQLRRACDCAPLYEPAWWNDAGQRQYNNNCYNYATNYRSDTYAQPGLAAGAQYAALTCAAVKPAAVQDALIDNPGAGNRCPREGHLVALVIAPGWDFHWYRKGQDGYWSHKPGGTPATNLDNSSMLIPDPRTADRGPYTQFCSFMVVMHGHIKIR